MKHALLLPLATLAAWTLLILLLVAVRRIRAVRAGRAKVADFALGESPAVPEDVQRANRNYMNLLEIPLLFYVAGVLAIALDVGSAGVTALAWSYVALRMLHSVVHLGCNHVILRLVAFSASNAALVGLWLAVLLASWPTATAGDSAQAMLTRVPEYGCAPESAAQVPTCGSGR